MSGFILGNKQRQSQRFSTEGKRIPTTFIKTDSCYLVDIKKHAVKLGFQVTKNIKRPQQGELKKAGIETPLRFLREIRFKDAEKKISLAIGEKLNPSALLKIGDKVDVSGISKGKGFQGVVKRHKFSGGPRTHGQSDRERAPGSIGQTTTPGRVYKGKRMAGRMGNMRVTMKNLEIVEIRDDGIVVKGLVPGAEGGLLEVRSN